MTQVNVSQGGVPKRPVVSADLSSTGVAGDTWRYPFHGGRQQAVLVVTTEGLLELVTMGFPLYPGALGENLTTRGLDRRDLRLGQRFQVGDAVIELTRPRTPCSTLDVYGVDLQAALYDARAQAGDVRSPRWGLSGFYAAVIRPGVVTAGDPIERLREERVDGAGRPDDDEDS